MVDGILVSISSNGVSATSMVSTAILPDFPKSANAERDVKVAIIVGGGIVQTQDDVILHISVQSANQGRQSTCLRKCKILAVLHCPKFTSISTRSRWRVCMDLDGGTCGQRKLWTAAFPKRSYWVGLPRVHIFSSAQAIFPDFYSAYCG